MTDLEKKYFDDLVIDRNQLAAALEKPALRGVITSVIEKYSEQAHFIYELLQNADDAKATSARFVLHKDRLVFAHNGIRHFSISNPANEECDREKRILGDINAITSIGNSTKENEVGKATIGKFGVGFKAVFQYTDTPYIYDPNFRFKIERLIVPSLLDEDCPERKQGETLFVFPFNHSNISQEKAFIKISEKLRKLSFPILFLNNLREIDFEIGDIVGIYGKEIKETQYFGDTIAERIVLTQNSSNSFFDDNLWLFSRTDENGYRYSVGYFLDKDGHLIPKKLPAFCFFPTKEQKNLNFIIHAPFLLTDSREGIRAGVEHNETLIEELATLSADALIYLRDLGKERNRLIDDKILDVIPIAENEFRSESNDHISYSPFFTKIKEQFKKEAIIPSKNGYVKSRNAYWASVVRLTDVFSNEQISSIVHNSSAKWAFPTLGRDEVQRTNRTLFNYIEDIVGQNLNEDIILNSRKETTYDVKTGRNVYSVNIEITKDFIEQQSTEWLHGFYKWLSETKHRTDLVMNKPIFLDQNKQAISAYDNNNQPILFLPVDGLNGFSFIWPELLKNKETTEFVRKLGIKEPSLRDQIYNQILPLYKNNDEDMEIDSHFKLFFNYFCECPNNETDDYIGLLRGYDFIPCCTAKEEEDFRGAAAQLYFPNQDLIEYFSPCKDILFVDFDYCLDLVGSSRQDELILFLEKLGVKKVPSIFDVEINPSVKVEGRELPKPYSTLTREYHEKKIEGCAEFLKLITNNHNKEQSIILWDTLVRVNETYNLYYELRGWVKYFYYSYKTIYFDASDKIALRHSKWLLNKSDEMCAPSDVFKEDLSPEYDTTSKSIHNLLTFLGINEKPKRDDSNLSEEQKEDVALATLVRKYGIKTEEDLKKYKEYLDAKTNPPIMNPPEPIEDPSGKPQTLGIDVGEGTNTHPKNEPDNGDVEKPPVLKPKRPQNLLDTVSRIIEKVEKDTEEELSQPKEDTNDSTTPIYEDEDEYTPVAVDYKRQIERAEKKSANELLKINYLEKLQNTAFSENANNKYSYLWFKTLLEMERINNQDRYSSQTISLHFSQVEKALNKVRTLILKHSNRGIPQYVEDLGDIGLVLHMGNKTKTLAIEVANIQSYNLRVKLKGNDPLKGIDFDSVTEATIDVNSPDFLLQSLIDGFKELGYHDEFNMKANLTEKIEFIFGPPGTGKTTYLARNVLMPLMKDPSKLKILVLTPTNKAADVLVKRIISEAKDDESYKNWLTRFGSTGDEDIEQNNIFRDRLFDITSRVKSVTVTTIARFPYDFFYSNGKQILLKDVRWDYIVIDEASMIPVANIIYPLYKQKNNSRFIIAGDPFQIQPITSVSFWKDENIYSLVKLNSFKNPTTEPHQYKVDLLTTQYRSVPDIGYLFSNYAYEGILKNNRTNLDQRPLNLNTELYIHTVNVIKFPVCKYESIYRCKWLKNSSSYQVYSALFTFEYVVYLSKKISESNPNNHFSIGIIAPYRAQADMIDRLISSEKLPEEIDVHVGTIHGFQGDECDIIFAVFNTPPTITDSKQMFLNNRNIINVSISRARDYLFIVMPDKNTEGIGKLKEIKTIENLIHRSTSCTEIHSPDLEQLMFGDYKYIENNAFSTSHQSVNVYGIPESRYEIRTEDTAVDVQIHRRSIDNAPILYPEPVIQNTTVTSSDLVVNMPNSDSIPMKLRDYAVIRKIQGKCGGSYYIVPYEDSFKKYLYKGKMSTGYLAFSVKGKRECYIAQILNGKNVIFVNVTNSAVFKHNLSICENLSFLLK